MEEGASLSLNDPGDFYKLVVFCTGDGVQWGKVVR